MNRHLFGASVGDWIDTATVFFLRDVAMGGRALLHLDRRPINLHNRGLPHDYQTSLK